jgi:hypothetical protein
MQGNVLTHTGLRKVVNMRIYRVVTVAVFIMSLVLLCFNIGCSGNGSNANGDGDGNGIPTITGEIVCILTYTTTMVPDPVSGIPLPETRLESYTPAIEDEDGNVFLLSAPGMHIHYEYDGMFLGEAITTIAGYTYTDYAPFNDENRYVGGKTRQISHTGIQVAVTGTIDTVTGYISGDMINVETIEELP